MADFDSKQTTFWGVVSGTLWFGSALLKYLGNKKPNEPKQEKEETKMSDVKEIKDVVIFANDFTLLVIQKLKDGFQVQDGVDLASALFQDGQIKNEMNEALKNISDVLNETKNLDAAAGVELGMLQLSYVPRYIDAFKK